MRLPNRWATRTRPTEPSRNSVVNPPPSNSTRSTIEATRLAQRENNCFWWWDQRPSHARHPHGSSRRGSHRALGLKGPFQTISKGTTGSRSELLHAYPLRRGAWVIRRYGPGVGRGPDLGARTLLVGLGVSLTGNLTFPPWPVPRGPTSTRAAATSSSTPSRPKPPSWLLAPLSIFRRGRESPDQAEGAERGRQDHR
jgi:hypothetical protein